MKNKNSLKIVSIILFIIGVANLAVGIAYLVRTIGGNLPVPEGQSKDLVTAAGYISFAGSLVNALLGFYLGIKGIQKANGQQISRVPHILGIILLVFQIIGVVTSCINIISAFTLTALFDLLIAVIEACGLVIYVKGTK